MALSTPLHDWHVAKGGVLVEFAGWHMPIRYGGIAEEHHAVRTACGLFDVSHMGRLSFSGDGLGLIQRVWTNDAAAMKDGQVRYGLICAEDGGILDDVLVYRWPYGWSMVVNASNRERIVAHLGAHSVGLDVKTDDQTLSTCMLAVQGPAAVAACAGMFDVDPATLKYYFAAPTRYKGAQCVVSRTGYSGEDGVEVMLGKGHAAELADDFVARGARPCGLAARDTLRLEAGMPLYGHELTEKTDPLAAGLGWAVKLDKGDFVGRDGIRERQADAARPVRVGLELEGRRAAREGAAVYRGEARAGAVTSGTLTPTLNKAVAMAYVTPDVAAAGTALEVEVGKGRVACRVVALPFYKRPK